MRTDSVAQALVDPSEEHMTRVTDTNSAAITATDPACVPLPQFCAFPKLCAGFHRLYLTSAVRRDWVRIVDCSRWYLAQLGKSRTLLPSRLVIGALHVGPNTPCELTGIWLILQSLTIVGATQHEGLRNMGGDVLEADTIARATTRPHSTLAINRLPRQIVAEIFPNCLHELLETVCHVATLPFCYVVSVHRGGHLHWVYRNYGPVSVYFFVIQMIQIRHSMLTLRPHGSSA